MKFHVIVKEKGYFVYMTAETDWDREILEGMSWANEGDFEVHHKRDVNKKVEQMWLYTKKKAHK